VRNYELVFIIAPVVEDDDLQAIVDRVSGWVEAGGGQVASVAHWGRRQLAYTIQKFTEGVYVLLNVQLEADALTELERNLKLDETIIRHLLTRAEE
jgi:small subunit ribosomal protein S6